MRGVKYKDGSAEGMRRQAALIDLSPDGILVRRFDGTITFWNEGAHLLYGWSKEEAVGRKTDELLKTEFPESVAKIFESLRRTGRWSGELRQHTRDGRVLTLGGRWLLQRGEGDQAEEILESNVDISDRKRAELRNDFLRETASLLLKAGDPETAIKYLCQRAMPLLECELFVLFMVEGDEGRFRVREMIGFEGTDLPADALQRCAAALDVCRGNGSVSRQSTDGEHHLALAMAPLAPFGVQGHLTRGLKVGGKLADAFWFGSRTQREFNDQDLSLIGTVADHLTIALERHHARVELQRGNSSLEQRVLDRTRELRETNEQLNSFCYSIAHDLKAPIRAQRAFAQLLEAEFGTVLGDTGRHYAKLISDAAERQGRMVSDLLSHMSLSRAELPLKPVELGQVLDQVRADLVLEIGRKHAEIIVTPFEEQVLANPASLYLVILNLVSNAIKFVRKDTVPRVRVWAEDRGDFLRIVVVDNGIGIPARYHHKLFGVFQRLHGGEEYPGTGIGLAIVKRAVQRMGGNVGLDSEPGKGSEFWVELPRAEAPKPEDPVPTRACATV